MSKSDALAGVRTALLESRMGSEMGELVRRYGGIPRHVPTVREIPVDCRQPVAAFLNALESTVPRVIVFLTGAGADALFDEAERQGRLPFLLETLPRATLACRGPKPTAALKRRRLAPAICARDPYTTVELLEALDGHDLQDVEVVLIHYGERNDTFARQLRARGASLSELCLYEWQLPENTEPIRSFIEDVVAGAVDTVVFTSQVQARHLLQVASAMGIAPAFLEALNTRTVVAAVGPVCRAALEEAGIVPHVVPANPKMAPLIASLAEYFATTKTRPRRHEAHGDTTARRTRRHDEQHDGTTSDDTMKLS